MKYEWVILDADGTLLDFRQAERMALQKTPIQLGIPVSEQFLDTYYEVNAGLWRAFEGGEIMARDVRDRRFRQVFGKLGLPGDPDLFSEVFLRNVIDASTLIPGAERLLVCLRERVGLVLLTNGFSDVQRARIERLRLGSAFDHVIISEEEGVAKPDPAIFEQAMARMGNPQRARVLVVGDSLSSDIQGGLDSGFPVCWFNPERETIPKGLRPTYEIASLEELPGLIGMSQESHGGR